MSKIFLIGDIHIGIHQLQVDKFLDITKDYFFNFFFPLLKEKFEEGDKLFILGDVFDNRNALNIKAISYTYDIFDWLEANNIPTHIILGNHDMYCNVSTEFNSLKILKKYSNITIYNEPTLIRVHNKMALMMPYISDVEEQQKELAKYQGQANYLFCHSDLIGARNNLIAPPLTHGPNIANFISYKLVYASHIHLRQKIQNFTFIGSPYHLDRNDKGDQKGVYILNTDTDTDEFIPNLRSPEFKSLDIVKMQDVQKLDDLLNQEKTKHIEDWYDININNSLMIEKPEISIKLMNLAQKKNLSKVSQVDDLVIVDTVKDHALEDIGISFSVVDMIREFVVRQDFKDDSIKTDIILELDDIIKTCLEGDLIID